MGKKRRIFAAKSKFGRKHSHLYKTEDIKEPIVEVKMEPTPVAETKPAPLPVIEAKAVPAIEDIPEKKPVKKRRTRATRSKKTTTTRTTRSKKTTTKSKE